MRKLIPAIVLTIVCGFAAIPAWAHPEYFPERESRDDRRHPVDDTDGISVIASALYNWAEDQTDRGYQPWYPDSVDALIALDYLKPYTNPYTGKAAQEVSFGWDESARGNYTYFKQYDRDAHVVGYILVQYGNHRDGGLDIDGDGKGDGVSYMIYETSADKADPFWSHGKKYYLDPPRKGEREWRREVRQEWFRIEP